MSSLLSRRAFLKSCLALAPLAAGYSLMAERAEARPLGERRYLPIGEYRWLWLENRNVRGESLRLDLYDPEHYKAACWLLRDWRAGQARACSPWLLHTAALMQAVIAEHVGMRPLKVLSGLRLPSTNKRVGGCKNSFHLPDARGMFYAMDFSVDGLSCEQVGALGRFLRQGGVGIYHSKDFVHMDVGNPRTWEKR
jgi:uncharacterized protein YcbK (DUF882 family)